MMATGGRLYLTNAEIRLLWSNMERAIANTEDTDEHAAQYPPIRDKLERLGDKTGAFDEPDDDLAPAKW